MVDIRETQRAIETVQGLKTVVSTMKTLSSVSIREYEKAVESLADYNRTVELGLRVVLQQRIHQQWPAISDGRIAAVIFGSDHGLCGKFNETVAQHAIGKIDELKNTDEEAIFLSVGARMDAQLKSLNMDVEESFFVPGSAQAITLTVQQILLKVDEWQKKRGVEQILLFYNRHEQHYAYQPHMTRLWPIHLHFFQSILREPWPTNMLPTYSMSSERLFSSLMKQYFFVTLFRASAESLASEHASRLMSMQAAEKNIEERLLELGSEFRQQRQDAITDELLDIVSGFEMIESKPNYK
ncbi:MAG: F0F1 ATP synthase subunit gamma [Gammaproteobacteria bacterium]|nr:F0F1 ATP synthase subunit gamma [Gammaproteobacteria bacterium]